MDDLPLCSQTSLVPCHLNTGVNRWVSDISDSHGETSGLEVSSISCYATWRHAMLRYLTVTIPVYCVHIQFSKIIEVRFTQLQIRMTKLHKIKQ